jgi:chemotaxis protein methyltransferase CheR
MQHSPLGGPEITEAQFLEISNLVKGLCGINLHEGKKELVRSRLSKRLRSLRLNSYREYLVYLRDDSAAGGNELVTLLDTISTNLTSFMRERAHFDYLADQVLPAAAHHQRNSPTPPRLRIWSAGCSTGEEPYTIALTLCEHLPQWNKWDIKILATDLSTRVLKVARQGEYEAQRLASLPAGWRNNYFERPAGSGDKTCRVRPEVRQLVHFARLNLMEAWPMRGPFEVIFCRNVMIYFDKKTQGELVRRFMGLLAPGGTLFIGHSESLTGIEHSFRYVQPTIYEKPLPAAA